MGSAMHSPSGMLWTAIAKVRVNPETKKALARTQRKRKKKKEKLNQNSTATSAVP